MTKQQKEALELGKSITNVHIRKLYKAGYGHSEIARELDIPESVVRNYINNSDMV